MKYDIIEEKFSTLFRINGPVKLPLIEVSLHFYFLVVNSYEFLTIGLKKQSYPSIRSPIRIPIISPAVSLTGTEIAMQ